MERHAGRTGTYLISWSQTLIDGHADAPEAALAEGAYWRWSGQAVDIGTVAGIFDDTTGGPGGIQPTEAARRIVGQALGIVPPQGRPGEDPTFMLSDGRSSWTGFLIDVPGSARPLLLFAGVMPPADLPLRVGRVKTRPGDEESFSTTCGAVCFTPGTWIDTPGGARQIEHLSAGDKVITVDGGAQELVWIGTRRLTLRALHRTPELAPVRIRAGGLADGGDSDLVVSPDHRMLMRNQGADAGETVDFLVSARDLVDGRAVSREPVTAPVTYVHLMLECHHILVANGFETESFHPAAADLALVPEADRARLFDVMPMLRIEPQVYGPWARPALTRSEAALLSAA